MSFATSCSPGCSSAQPGRAHSRTLIDLRPHRTYRPSMDRRRFLLTSLAGALIGPLAARAQPARIPRLGVLLFGTPAADAFPSIRRGLEALGYVEGRNILFEHRYAEGRPERLPDLASDLVRSKPDVIIAAGGDVAPFAKRATSTIPIVVITSADPVQGGLVAGLARPGGNVTGLTFVSSELAGKRLQFLKEAAPGVTRVAVLWNPDHPDGEFPATQTAAGSLAVQVQSLEVRGRDDFTGAFAAANRERMEAVVVASSRLMTLNRARILELATQNRLLVASGWGPWAAEGGLLSYGPDLDAVIRRSAIYVDRILKGARPADIPVEQPTKFELVINLKTARRLGLTIPPSLLQRADHVIE
jgi:putative tryptophan/tyrosine transport system substrate-binding protein